MSTGSANFEPDVKERFQHDAVLVEIARIVQAADFQDQLDDHPAARGWEVISKGFPAVTGDDHVTVERACFIYDALYASVKIKLLN